MDEHNNERNSTSAAPESSGENMSLDDIIRLSEKIRQEMEEAQQSARETAERRPPEVTVDEQAVQERIDKVYQKIEEQTAQEEDVREYIPKGSRPVRTYEKPQEPEEREEDVKIAPPAVKDTLIFAAQKTQEVKVDESTRPVYLREDMEKVTTGNMDSTEVYMTKVKYNEQTGLNELPMIIAKDNLVNGFVQDGEAEKNDDGQMRFDGFTEDEKVPLMNETEAEQIVAENRRETVAKFRLFGPDKTDTALGNDTSVKSDFANLQEKENYYRDLQSKKNSLRIKMLVTLALAVPIILMTLFKDSSAFPSFLSAHTAYFTVSAVLYAAVLAVNGNILAHGFRLKQKRNFDLPVALVSLLIMAHTVTMLFNRGLYIDNGILLTAAGTFSLFMSQLGKYRMMSRIINNFKFISSGSAGKYIGRYTLENIANGVDAGIICRGILDEEEEPVIKTSVKTDFPSYFMEISTKREPADRLMTVIFLAALLGSTALFFAVGIMNNFYTAANMALATLALTLPCCALYHTNTVLSDISKGLKNYGARVCGYEGAAMAQGGNCLVMEASDLFGTNSCQMHGFQTYNCDAYTAVVYTASVLERAKSPLSKLFERSIVGQKILPKVEDLKYETSMGLSAWIYKHRVLVGNRDLMTRHSVKVPVKSFEKKHLMKGQEALYLAIDGELSAMYVVSYNADPDLKRELRKLEKSDITLIVKSGDPYLNEKNLANLFAVPEGFIRVMNQSAARVYEKYSDMEVKTSPAYVVHNGSALGLISAMHASQMILNSAWLISFLSCIGSAFAFAGAALLCLLGAYTPINALNIILVQAIWNAFILMLNKVRVMMQ